ncbi:hypothetical protein LINGRAHAP2_LOCUS11412 [Linum grandiflorum]
MLFFVTTTAKPFARLLELRRTEGEVFTAVRFGRMKPVIVGTSNG